MSNANRDEIVEVVKGRLLLENEMRERGDLVLLRDPSGQSLHRHLLERNPGALWHFVDEQGRTASLPFDGWICGLDSIAKKAHVLEQQVIYHHWDRYSTPLTYLKALD